MKQAEKVAVCAKAILHYGCEKQTWKAVEELGELASAIAKRQQAKEGTPECVIAHRNLLDEMADATIMMEQLRIMEGIAEEELEDRITFKLGRLAGRMEKPRE